MEQSYRIVIVDDEPPARDIIEEFTNHVPDLEIVAICGNAREALEAIQNLKPDLVFLDIQMPEMTGMELMKIPLTDRPEFVLTTAYPQYALESYDFATLDYLMKPIAFDRFMATVVKLREKRKLGKGQPNWEFVDSSLNGESIWVRDGKRVLQIPNEEIFYVEGWKDYVKVFYNDKMLLTHLSLGQAEAVFQTPTFVRIHRSHIIRVAAIRVIDGNEVELSNGIKLDIGQKYREDVKKYIPFLR